jgi:cytochrome c oxidase subunit 3
MNIVAIESSQATADHDREHHGTGHDPSVAHHFESAEQQFAAGKLGMWLFLGSELLFFSGLFVAYAIYRSSHPEIFIEGHKHLSVAMGTLNTIVLLLSSLTMAWAVRCAQLNQQRGLVNCLIATLVCATFFMGVKSVEYYQKWSHGYLWAGSYDPQEHGYKSHGGDMAHSSDPPADATTSATTTTQNASPPHGVFFSIYFAMTGIHALHIFAGMGAIGWLIQRARRGEFHSRYFGPVDYVGLYWHLVDLIWIYLFPMLYLIH